MTVKYYSIGCDCHPSVVLKYLKLRHKAGPFDWIYTKPLYSPEYFLKLVNSSFIHFTDDLVINDNNKVISKYYPHTEFSHDDDLITNIETKQKYERRVKRFMDDYKNSRCVLLLTIKYNSFCNKNEVFKLSYDIKNILDDEAVKKNHILFIYLRYDGNLNDNKELCDLFIELLSKLKYKNLVLKKYSTYSTQFGIWGNHLEYSQIFTYNSENIENSLELM